jgi:dipeptide/tripeptide permease
MSLGFLALPVGIAFADASGRSPFFWLFASYVCSASRFSGRKAS